MDADIEAGEIRVKGLIHTKKIQERIEKLSKKKVEIVSPQAKIKDSVATEKTVKVNTKEVSTVWWNSYFIFLNLINNNTERWKANRQIVHRYGSIYHNVIDFFINILLLPWYLSLDLVIRVS